MLYLCSVKIAIFNNNVMNYYNQPLMMYLERKERYSFYSKKNFYHMKKK